MTATDSRPTWPGRDPDPNPRRAPLVEPGHSPFAASVAPVDGGADGRIATVPQVPEVPPSGPCSLSTPQTTDLLESLSTLVERARTIHEGQRDSKNLLEHVRRFAWKMQRTVSKLGGIAHRTSRGEQDERESLPGVEEGRQSVASSASLDGYRPDRDVVAPISIRPNAMELLWVCGDCHEHYPRARECPAQCVACGAPRQHFYAPIED